MAKQVRSVVKIAKVKSVLAGHNFSIRATEDLENGFFVKLGDLEKANLDVHGMTKPAAGDGEVVLIANDAIIYDNARKGSDQERYYYIEEGKIARGYELAKHDVVGITKAGIEGNAVEGQYLKMGANYKLVPSATKPATGFAAKVVRFERVGGIASLNVESEAAEYVMFEVLAN